MNRKYGDQLCFFFVCLPRVSCFARTNLNTPAVLNFRFATVTGLPAFLAFFNTICSLRSNGLIFRFTAQTQEAGSSGAISNNFVNLLEEMKHVNAYAAEQRVASLTHAQTIRVTSPCWAPPYKTLIYFINNNS